MFTVNNKDTRTTPLSMLTCLYIFMHPRFQLNFIVSSTRFQEPYFTKLLAVSQISIKKARSYRTLTVILLTSVVICKKRVLHRNENVEYLQNCKYYNVSQDHFGKLL